MTEDRRQHDIVMWFYQTYPHLDNQLFMVQNNTYSQAHGKRMVAMGLKKNVSDLLFYSTNIFAGIEVKIEGSSHPRDHIEGQLKFGESLIKNGHYFIISHKEEPIKHFINLLLNDPQQAQNYANEINKYTIDLLAASTKKTIIFGV
jgi:hypothetical protein